MGNKLNIGILFGGQSVEHEVSIITGLQIYENIDKTKYNATPIYISKDGKWCYGKKLCNTENYKNFTYKGLKTFAPSVSNKDKKNYLNNFDCIINAFHGNFGEDGKVQSLLEFINIPYSSSGVVGSAAGMDKIVMKNIFSGMGLPVLPFVWFNKTEWYDNKKDVINKVHYTVDYPVFVKPANLGSSIGISKVKNEDELINAIEIAIRYDHRVIVERGLDNSIEINCSAFKEENVIRTSVLEEPVHWEDFLSFNDKYLTTAGKSDKSSGSGSGMADMSRKIPAEVDKHIEEHIKEYTTKIYQTMDCHGVVRLDFLMDENKEKLFVNEINTIPGSMSFYLWEHSNISFKELISKIIEESLKLHNIKQDKILRYDSRILDRNNGSKTGKLN